VLLALGMWLLSVLLRVETVWVVFLSTDGVCNVLGMIYKLFNRCILFSVFLFSVVRNCGNF